MPVPAFEIAIIGAGLAGSEAAWQAARHGAHVTLYEMRPQRMTPAHQTGRMAELVCSNSLGSKLPDRALGLLKNELRRLGSLIFACADRTAIPAGDALAVDREAFSQAVTEAVERHPNIEVRREEVTTLDPPGFLGSRPVTIVATGPLTSQPLAQAIRRLAGQESLSFFDAMAPIVTAESIDVAIAWRGNRWEVGRGAWSGERRAGERRGRGAEEQGGGNRGAWSDGVGEQGEPSSMAYCPSSVTHRPSSVSGDYINCPLSRDEYYAFVEAVNRAERNSLREFEQDDAARRYFEACLPIEVLAGRDPDALAFGPMTPVGLRDPRTNRRPFAVVQLRQDNAAGTLYNLVGFQTNIKWGDQERLLRMIPGLEHAEFVRFGQMHRNTFINSPALLRPTLQWHDRDDLFFAGQITGTEGYVGSAAGGLLAGLNAVRLVQGLPLVSLPLTTMTGALFHYITRRAVSANGSKDPIGGFQPMKANFGLLPELNTPVRDKRLRHRAYADRALADLEAVLAAARL